MLVPIYSLCSSLANLQSIRSVQLPIMILFSCTAWGANRLATRFIADRGDIVSAFGAFVIGLPLAVVLGLFTPLGVIGVFAARVIEELAKVAIFSQRSRRVRWDVLARRQQPGAAREVDELEQLA